MAPCPSTHHVVIFPFMAQGHTIPLLDLAKALSSKKINVTIITTPSNAKSILDHVSKHPNITLTELPFPIIDGLPHGCENTSQLPSMEFHPPFLMATKRLQEPFEQVLNDMKQSHQGLPLCVVSDFFLGFTQPVCQAFGIPRLVFHGMGVLPMAICKASWVHKQDPGSDQIELPGLKLPFVLTASDLPHEVVNSSDLHDPMSQFLEEVGEADVNSWGVIVNSFVDLEMGRVSFFESFYKDGASAWCIGPLNLYDQDISNTQNTPFSSTNVMKLLEEQESRTGSVLYVSFGTQADVSNAQLDEVGFGLVDSGVPFIWVVRSKTWTPPNDMKERLNDSGSLIVSDWVDQRRILSHVSVEGFLSHCGWNSVLESLSVGVPILAWPMMAEQALNARVVVDGLGAGIRVRKAVAGGSGNDVVSRQAISKGVRELMGPGEKGRNVRERAKVLGGLARRAVEEGGSSFQTLDELLQKLQCEC